MSLNATQINNLNHACPSLEKAKLGTAIGELETTVGELVLKTSFVEYSHTVVAEDIADENAVIQFEFNGIPSGVLFTMVDDTNKVITGYDLIMSEDSIVISMDSTALPIGSKVFGIAW